MKVCVLLIFLCVVFNCDAKPEGAPISACSSLTPVHSQVKAQTDDPPYTVKAVKYGDKIKVTVSSPIGEEFQGFVLQARAATDRTRFIDGEFSESEVAKTQDCFNKNKNTLTHNRPTPKREVVTEWTPRGGVNEDVVFRATVAKTYAVFWTEIDSAPIKIGSDGSKPNARKASNLDGNSMYDECFVSRGCFGFPSGCAQRRDCEVLLTYARAQDSVEFDMHGYLDSSEYMAMGISQDAVMGEDSVKECIRQGSEVVVRDSWNEGKSNTRTKALEKEEYISSFTNGLSSCSWSEPLAFEAHGQNFNLATNNYYVLLAKGGVSDGRLVYHAASKLSTGVAVNFTAFESIAGAGVTDSVKIHGTFMVTAWVGFVSFAILLARHFKNTWEDRTLGGVKIWFALHRGFMVSGLLFVVVAFVVIFVHKNGWNYATSNPHATLGCIATALGLFNPIMAAFRPAPDHSKRPLFNWLHWGVGNSAQIVAVIAIFFAVSLPSSGLDKRVYWVMAVYVIVHLLVHLLYQVHSWTRGKKKSNELRMNDMKDARSYTLQNEESSKRSDTSDNEFRIYMLCFYTMFIIAILTALYSLIGVA